MKLVDRLHILANSLVTANRPEDAILVRGAAARIEAAERAIHEAEHAPGYGGWKRTHRALVREQDGGE